MTRVTSITLDRDAAETFRADLVRVIRESLGLPEKVAVPMADELAKGLKQRLGGLYIPAREIREARDNAVLRDFNGRNHSEVMRIHRLSRATFYRILSRNTTDL
jgi:Mor family transcriptional regulator